MDWVIFSWRLVKNDGCAIVYLVCESSESLMWSVARMMVPSAKAMVRTRGEWQRCRMSMYQTSLFLIKVVQRQARNLAPTDLDLGNSPEEEGRVCRETSVVSVNLLT